MTSNTIHVLDASTIDKIAAGEVIERPASIVKELVENAIDAGADRITVDITEGGIRQIRVTDNGSGIAAESVPLAFLRHATSKIEQADDLLAVDTLGFRGEALASIAAVSKVEMITKTKDEDTGTKIEIEGGKQISLQPVGAPEGTSVTVRQLFYNVPVRRKFLKTAMTEAVHVHEVMEQLALSHPSIAFVFVTNGQEKLVTGGSGDTHETLMRIFGPSIGRHMLPVHAEKGSMTLEGLTGAPAVSRGNRAQEVFFVNQRIVRSPALTKALEEAYKGYTMQHRFPICALYLSVAPDEVDINIHPTKSEVRFTKPQEVSELVREAVAEVLAGGGLVEQVSAPRPAQPRSVAPAPAKQPPADAPEEEKLDYFMDQMRARVQAYHEQATPAAQAIEARAAEENAGEQLTIFKEETQQNATHSYRLLGQLFGTYWLVESDQTLYIVDQHAAHEKILFEQTMEALRQREILSQRVSPPIVVHLTPRQEELLSAYRDHFVQLGYDIEDFGERTVALSAVPSNLFSLSGERLFTEILDQAREEIDSRMAPEIIREKIASLSCKAAVKGNTTMDARQMDTLLKRLFELDNPYHCPHGRPTMIAMTRAELDKKFKRIV